MDVLRQSTRRALDRSVARAQIERISRGRYALPGLPPALKTADALRGTLSHASAAHYWKLESVCDPVSVHVTVPRGAHRIPDRAVTLHYADLGDRVTDPLRTVLDCARSMAFREGLAIADSALRRGLLTSHELVRAADLLTGPGSLRARTVCASADGRAANPFESALRATVIDSRVGGFQPQLLIKEDGAWRVDLGDRARRIALEADSFAFHGTRAALDRDCRRYDELVSRGWLVLRFSWEQVMFDEPWVQRMVIDSCALRADRPGGTIDGCSGICAARVA